MNRVFTHLGRRLAQILTAPRHVHLPNPSVDTEHLKTLLRVGDVLLVDGDSLIGAGIKYLTQSSWSHAALYVGRMGAGSAVLSQDDFGLVEADLTEGVRWVPFETYASYNTRICRPFGLDDAECAAVARFALARLGYQYDLSNLTDLLRYLIPNPPVPVRFRRRLLALGSGDPTRAICSTLIAQAFQSLQYPVMPSVQVIKKGNGHSGTKEVYRARSHRLIIPRDFDVSPYFRIVKPLDDGHFDYRAMQWEQ